MRIEKSIGIFLIISGSVQALQQKCSSAHVKEYKTEIQSKANPEHFASMEREVKNKGVTTQEQYWRKKLKEVNDSLKIDSASKKAYFEGAQMVRDSINNTK